MNITQKGASLLQKYFRGDCPEIRLLVTGGDGQGFRIELEANQTEWPGDARGDEHGIKWRVDPVSWQFVSTTTLDAGSAADELVLHGVPDIGPSGSTKSLTVTL